MNRAGYFLGIFLRASYALSLVLFAVTVLVMAFLLRPAPTTYSVAPVVVIENGKPARLACDAKDGEYRAVAVINAQDLAHALLSTGSGAIGSETAAYSKLVRENAQRILDGSDAAGKFGEITKKNLDKMTTQRLVFVLDTGKTQAVPSKDGREYYVLLNGQQRIQKAQGSELKNVEINVTLQFDPKRGDTGEIFQITAFTIRDSNVTGQ